MLMHKSKHKKHKYENTSFLMFLFIYPFIINTKLNCGKYIKKIVFCLSKNLNEYDIEMKYNNV